MPSPSRESPPARTPISVAHVLFDLDGTLVDSFPGIARAAAAAFDECAPQCGAAIRREWLGPPIAAILRKALNEAQFGGDEALADRLERSFRTHYDGEAWTHGTLFPGVNEVLSQLHRRGVGLFVVTNKPRRPTAQLLERFRLRPLFAECVSPDDRRPSYASKAEMIAELVDRRGIAPPTALYVGDTDEDARAAETAGMPFVPVSFGYGRPATSAVCAPLSDLTQLLNVVGDGTPTVAAASISESHR